MTDPELLAALRAAKRTLPGWYTAALESSGGKPFLVYRPGAEWAESTWIPDLDDDGFAGQLFGDIIAAGLYAQMGKDNRGCYCVTGIGSEETVYEGTTLARAAAEAWLATVGEVARG